MRLTTPEAIEKVLRELGLKPQKLKGQNFLHDLSALKQIASFAGLSKSDRVIEIGPGLGALTAELLTRVENLTVVEFDPILADWLARTFSQLDANSIILEDIRQLSLDQHRRGEEDKFVVVSNLPYSISSDVILWILENRPHIDRASLLLQKEFAERVAAGPGTKAYGAISVKCQLYADVKLGETIASNCFHPAPAVDSQLLEIRLRQAPAVAVVDETRFEQIVRGCFSTRRKTLLNCLSRMGIGEDKGEIGALLENLGIAASRRPETLSLAEFASISDALSEKK